jgi:S1-C subfamily serine protease
VLRVAGLTGAPAARDAAESLRAGALALAVGRSAETGVHASLGMISAVHGAWRTWRGGRIDRFIRLDMGIDPGLSGAAVVGPAQQVLGIATAGLSRFAALAIPVSTVDRVVDELLAKGHVSRPYLGVGLHPVRLPEAVAKSLNRGEPAGLIVLTVEPGSPAEAAGITVGDVLTMLGDQPLRDVDDVQTALDRVPVGQAIVVGAVRGGGRQDFSVTVGERPRGEGAR